MRFIKLTIDENFAIGTMKGLRVAIGEISCYYIVEKEVIKRDNGVLVKAPYQATIVNLKQGAEFYVKETPEEIDKLIDPVTYYAKIERGDPFEIKEDK